MSTNFSLSLNYTNKGMQSINCMYMYILIRIRSVIMMQCMLLSYACSLLYKPATCTVQRNMLSAIVLAQIYHRAYALICMKGRSWLGCEIYACELIDCWHLTLRLLSLVPSFVHVFPLESG